MTISMVLEAVIDMVLLGNFMGSLDLAGTGLDWTGLDIIVKGLLDRGSSCVCDSMRWICQRTGGLGWKRDRFALF